MSMMEGQAYPAPDVAEPATALPAGRRSAPADARALAGRDRHRRATPVVYPHRHPARSVPPNGGGAAHRLGVAFYTAALLVALTGATTAATGWLGWPLPAAAIAVAVVELGGVSLAARADHRRRLGEHAVAARVVSAAVAGFAVTFQWLGHADHRQGLFFAGTSALAYTTWLITSADRRRDQLRVDEKLPATAPVYGAVRWLRHPWLTRRARALAVADPTLGLFGSLKAADAAIRSDRRQAALAELLRRRIAQGRDRLAAEIVVTTYDLDEIAARLAAGADYAGLTALIAAELRPDQVAHTAPLTPPVPVHHDGPVTPDVVVAGPPDVAAVHDSTVGPAASSAGTARRGPGTGGADEAGRSGHTSRAGGRRGADTAARIAHLRDRRPRLSTVDIAGRVGVTDRTVRRHLAALRQTEVANRHGADVGTRPDNDPDSSPDEAPTGRILRGTVPRPASVTTVPTRRVNMSIQDGGRRDVTRDGRHNRYRSRRVVKVDRSYHGVADPIR